MCWAQTPPGGAGPMVGHGKGLLILVAAQRQLQAHQRCQNLQTTHAFPRLLRLSTAILLFGRVHQAERSCATEQAQAALALKFSTATASSMYSAPSPTGGVGASDGAM